jgi:hypothetical protein
VALSCNPAAEARGEEGGKKRPDAKLELDESSSHRNAGAQGKHGFLGFFVIIAGRVLGDTFVGIESGGIRLVRDD